MNFLISWPGFLIFAPAWNGFIYYLNITTDISIKQFDSGDVIISRSYNTKYRCNQAEFDRTFIEISWLGLDYFAIALIGGIFNVSYDDDITPDVNFAAFARTILFEIRYIATPPTATPISK